MSENQTNTSYIVVIADSTLQLEDKVKVKLADGWTPLGGIAITDMSTDGFWYYQAMIKTYE